MTSLLTSQGTLRRPVNLSKLIIDTALGCVHPRGVRNRNAKERYVEILSFQHFVRYTTLTTDGNDFRNKVLEDKIEVSVVLDMECVDENR